MRGFRQPLRPRTPTSATKWPLIERSDCPVAVGVQEEVVLVAEVLLEEVVMEAAATAAVARGAEAKGHQRH